MQKWTSNETTAAAEAYKIYTSLIFFLRKNILFLFNYEYMYYVACMSYARLVFVLYFKLAHWYLQSIG